MLSDLGVGARWNASLGAKFVRVVPYHTLTIIVFTLVSQIAMLAASFLPLKVIIMLGSEGVPTYFPSFLVTLGRDVLIGILSAGTVGFFLIHLLSERVIESVTERATARLLGTSQKMVLFEKQEVLAASAYQRYSRSLAGAIFIGLAFLGLGWFYTEMLGIIFAYFTLVVLLFWQGARHSVSIRDRLERKLSSLMSVTTTTGFFIAFGYLVLDFVLFSPPSVIVALVCFLLIRQAMQRVSGSVVDLVSLYRQKDRLTALFFHSHIFHPPQVDPKNSFWPLLMPTSGQRWVADVLKTAAGLGGDIESSWYQLGNMNVVALRVFQEERCFLLKLYEPRRSSLALHEIDLMSDAPSALPAPRWVGSYPVEKFHCLVYELPPGERAKADDIKPLHQQFRADLLAASPQKVSERRYMRSKAMLWQRLDEDTLGRIELAVRTEEQRSDLAILLKRIAALRQLLKGLPLAIFNAELSQDTLWAAEDGLQGVKPILLSWGRWTLEPVGAGWPEAESSLAALGEALQAGAAIRPELAEVEVEQAKLAALAFALERECSRQRYNQALDLIPRILECMAALEPAKSSNPIGNTNAG